MCLLIIVGFFLAVAAWSVHPLLGIVVGFLFMGGAGWQVILGLLGKTFGRLTKTGRRAYGPEGKAFIAAWEARRGEMEFGQPRTYPPPGAFQQWLRDHEQTGLSVEDWIDRALGRPYGPIVFRRHVVNPDGQGAEFRMRRRESGWYWDVEADEAGLHVLSDEWDIWCQAMIAELNDEARAAAGIFHATWRNDGIGVTFERGPDGGFTARLDDGVEYDMLTIPFMNTAWAELHGAHGQPPIFGGRTSSTPIEWSPPLPTSLDDATPS